MINLLTVSDIPTIDPDFDDLELLYDDCEDASPEEQELYDSWCEYDERAQDKLDHAKPVCAYDKFSSAFDELMDRWADEMEP